MKLMKQKNTNNFLLCEYVTPKSFLYIHILLMTPYMYICIHTHTHMCMYVCLYMCVCIAGEIGERKGAGVASCGIRCPIQAE